MTLTQVFTRFLKDYLPQGAYGSWIIAITNRDYNKWSYGRRYEEYRIKSWYHIPYYLRYQVQFKYNAVDQSDICSRYLTDNPYGRNVYGVCGRLVENYLSTCFDYMDSHELRTSVLNVYRKLWRMFVDEYVILPKKPNSFYQMHDRNDQKLMNSFGIRKNVERCSLDLCGAILKYDRSVKAWEI